MVSTSARGLDFRQNPWFVSLMLRLLQGSPPVLALLDSTPAGGP